jgi:hypothetical protein
MNRQERPRKQQCAALKSLEFSPTDVKKEDQKAAVATAK